MESAGAALASATAIETKTAFMVLPDVSLQIEPYPATSIVRYKYVDQRGPDAWRYMREGTPSMYRGSSSVKRTSVGLQRVTRTTEAEVILTCPPCGGLRAVVSSVIKDEKAEIVPQRHGQSLEKYPVLMS